MVANKLTMPMVAEMRALAKARPVQLLALTAFLGAVVWTSFRTKLPVLDLDIWWHMRTGDWILEHRAFPHTGLFTWTAGDKPWAAYSWGYEILLSRAYAWFGLVGIGVFGTLVTLAVAYAVYWMLRRLSGRFWPALLLTIVATSAFLFKVMPRPVSCSMILFCITVTLVLEAKRSGSVKLLYWLPLTFLIWANLHIQFVYGLVALGLLLAVDTAQHLLTRTGWQPVWLAAPALPPLTVLAVLVASVLATCIGPYSFHLYGIILQYARAQVPYKIIVELRPLHFRVPAHYVQLLLTGFGFFAVGRRQKVDAFKLALLVVASAISFRAMRDAWFICITAAACIADPAAPMAEPEARESWVQNAALAVAVVVLMVLFAQGTNFNSRDLDAAISYELPVNAANYLRKHPAPGPLYNTFNWGGFLIWYMPDYPVAIDGRTDLYGDELTELFFETINGAASYASDPYLDQSGIVLLENHDGLVNALNADPRFQRVYQDALATMFVRNR